MNVVEVENLRVVYGPASKDLALDDTSFTVRPGEVVALLGPNGAGKTTLLETLQGYRKPTAGQVRVFGLDPAKDRAALASRWGVMPQAGGIPMGLTVKQAVRLFGELHGSAVDYRQLIEAAGLGDKMSQRWRKLSGGEQQRLSLTLALCGGQDLLMLDEPTAAVDAQGRQRILDIISSRARSGSSVLITTHRFDDVEAVADRVVILNHGTVVADDTLRALTSGFDEISFDSSSKLDTAAMSTALGHQVHKRSGDRYVLDARPDPQVVASLTAWLSEQDVALQNLQVGQRSLEDLFIALTEPTPRSTAALGEEPT